MIRWKELLRRAIAVVWPDRCIFCGTVIPTLHLCCDACRERLSIVRPPICRYCGQSKEDCTCKRKRAAYDHAAAPFYYEEAVKEGILRLKRQDDPDLLEFLSAQMATVVHREYADEMIDGVVYVPMTKQDVRKREYNQGALLACSLSKRLSVPVYEVLTKLYETPPQRSLGVHERSGNVLGVFDVTDSSVRDKTLLLVDDVLTTGATLHECAKMLKIYGAKRVLVITAAVRKRKQKTDE